MNYVRTAMLLALLTAIAACDAETPPASPGDGHPATLAGTWVGKRIVGRISDRLFVVLVELGLLAAGTLFLLGF